MRVQIMARVETIVFLSLVLDLFAFTIPLPLFPRLIEWVSVTDITVRLIRPEPFLQVERSFAEMGRSSVRTLQFFVSPKIGSLSDKYGRKRVLLITMIGNILSAIVWIQSTTFASYMLSRVIGGLSEGNVQLAMTRPYNFYLSAILSDVTTSANRSKALAHVGIAFAICFCIGPPIGAYFASRPLPHSMDSWGPELNIYAAPAFLTLVLLVGETVFLMLFLPETRGRGPAVQDKAQSTAATKSATNGSDAHTPRKASVEERIATLKVLRRQHFLFLAIFSGMEFTLTFLTFDLLDWNNKQNGMLIGSIGIMSALLQGGYVRRATSKIGEGVMARRGVACCALGLLLLAVFPLYVSTKPALAMKLLQGSAVCLAFTSATVVSSLTAFASLQCDEGGFDDVTGKPREEHPQLTKGKALGQFRSSGQLGRAMGPLLACASYWTFGPSITYVVSALAMFVISVGMRSIAVKRIL
ncbi:hypothetical protein DXG01_003063 [Tephrocybe rancida]|nr:hypothetical protein DXG01_003063 [Tephrocybe rancida]